MDLKLVKKIVEARDTKSFFFEKPKDFNFESGQYLILKIGNEERQLTISSSPTEDFIQITTRIRAESTFKQALDKLEIGSIIEAHGPFGSFVLDFQSSVLSHVFLAGGIGITPFRSMIKYSIDKNLKIPMILIYSNSDSEFVFKKELDIWQKQNKNFKIYYHDSSNLGHLDINPLTKLYPVPYSLNPIFYAVGPKNFVNAMEDILEELKIPSDQIKTEKFIGY